MWLPVQVARRDYSVCLIQMRTAISCMTISQCHMIDLFLILGYPTISLPEIIVTT